MKKILFAAASLPVLMASCTQDVIESEMNPGNTPNAKGFQLELNATKGDNDITRGYKTDSHGMVFEGNDQINMFWLNSDPGVDNYSQTFNSIFNIEKQEDDESSSFKSKSLVYGGFNVATFPGQYTTSTGDIVLTVSNIPGGIVNIPYMSNLIDLNCANNKQGDNQTTGNLQKGFNNKLSMPMKQTANFAELDIEFSKIATGIEGYEDGMKVEKITFVSDAAAFAEKAYIKTEDNSVTTNGKWSYTVRVGNANVVKDVYPIVAETKTFPHTTSDELASTAVTVENNGNTSATTTGKAYLMSFPTGATTTTGSGSIIINTNMGIVTIETVIEGTGDEAVNKTPLFNSENKNVTVESVFDALAAYHKNTRENSKFKNEIVGKYVPRTLKVDMTTAVIDGSVVKSSADIVRYVNLYNKLGKDDNMTLVLHEDFTGLDAEALSKLNSKDKFKLDADAVSSITLLGGGNVKDATPKAAKFINLPSTINFDLEAGQDWTMAQNMAVEHGSNTYEYTNKGTLTIAAAEDAATKYKVTNDGTVEFTGDVELGQYVANNGSTTTITASQNITFLGATSLNGTVTVASAAQLLAAGSANVKIGATGVVNNSGFLAVQIGGTAGITNVGTINVVDNAATTLITNNAEGAALGTINLNARDNEVAVGEPGTQGNIAILTSKLADPAIYQAKAGDKMNKLIIDAGNITIAEDAAILYIEVKNNASIYNKNATTLTINTLTVNNNKTLNIPTGQAIQVSTLTKIKDNAKIIVGGTLKFGNCDEQSQIYTTGGTATVTP